MEETKFSLCFSCLVLFGCFLFFHLDAENSMHFIKYMVIVINSSYLLNIKVTCGFF